MNAVPISIVVMGVSGSGKSTIGRLAATVLDCPYLEGDTFHSAGNVAKMAGGIPLDDDDRWPWLDRLGTALGEATARNGVAIASCSALKRSYRDRLRGATGCRTAFVHLVIKPEELARRLRARSDHYMPPSLLDSQLATLQHPDEAELARDFDGLQRPENLMKNVCAWIATLS